jgi:succinate dehydrogenase / fumarate reductase cytochrome b subunit
VKDPRPVNLNLLTIRFPITAIASILHRASGVVLFLFIPALLWMLAQSLESAQRFAQLAGYLDSFGCKFIAWGLISAFVYHLFAGLRHLLMDAHIGADYRSGRLGAMLVIILALIVSVLAGVWLW